MLDTVQESLCPTLEAVVLLIAEEIDYIAAPHAPETYRQLVDHLDGGNRLVVYDGGCEHTMFGNLETNYAFRAWHDITHYRNRYDFSVAEEMFTCCAQIQDVLVHFGPEIAAECSPFLIADLIGQRVYYERYKEYVLDQRAFVLAYIEDSRQALSRRW